MESRLRSVIEDRLGPMSRADWSTLSGIIDGKYVLKGQKLLEFHEFCHHVWFLGDGAFKAFEKYKDVERVTDLHLPGEFFTDYTGLTLHRKADVSFVAAENSAVIQINYAGLLAAAERSPYLANFARFMMEVQILRETEHRRLMVLHDAEERYRITFNKCPEFFQRFSLKDISHYLGITPESLSRLRRRMLS